MPEDESIALIAARNLNTLKELDPSIPAALYGWETPKLITIEGPTLHSIKDFVSNMEESTQEGVVVCDSSFNRLKVKCPQYLRLEYLKSIGRKNSNLSDRELLNVIIDNKRIETQNLFPEHADRLDILELKLKNLKNQVNSKSVASC